MHGTYKKIASNGQVVSNGKMVSNGKTFNITSMGCGFESNLVFFIFHIIGCRLLLPINQMSFVQKRGLKQSFFFFFFGGGGGHVKKKLV